ncbi:unnamed protein product [Cochlearia groenlandica]
MVIGILEVSLISGKGLKRSDFLGKVDPYVEIQYKGQTRKSSVDKDGGRNPTWNDTLKWRAEFPGSGSDYKLIIKVMDHDTFSSDDFIGATTVYVKELLEMGVEKGNSELRPTKYNVVDSDNSFVGEILLGVTYSLQDRGMDAEDFGGWKHSQVD